MYCQKPKTIFFRYQHLFIFPLTEKENNSLNTNKTLSVKSPPIIYFKHTFFVLL